MMQRTRRTWTWMASALVGLTLAAPGLWAQTDADKERPETLDMASGSHTKVQARIAGGKPLSDDDVLDSMKMGIDYLLASRKGDIWEPSKNPYDQEGGVTALVVYSLLHAGRSAGMNDPRLHPRSKDMAPAVNYLMKLEADRTYVSALAISALALCPKSPENTAALWKFQKYIVEAMGQNGGYTYGSSVVKSGVRNPFESTKEGDFRPSGDLSNGQYGTLGAWALSDAGIELPNAYWATSDRFWRLTQNSDGSWPYIAGKPDQFRYQKLSMTLAGLASLHITSEFTDIAVRLTNRQDKNVDQGLAMLTREFRPNMNLYSLYGLERVGLATGLKFFNDTNWYREGARNVVLAQRSDGSWNYSGNAIGTAYALLFLARGRNPVVFNKLEYPGETWNARPRDNANLTRWMSKRFEREINWQVVNLKVKPEDWLDAPILLITGSRDPKFAPGDIAKLRAFVEAGGMIFSNSDGGSEEFNKAVRVMAGAIVDRKYELRELPADHPIFNVFTEIKTSAKMYGLSNGSRELWIHSPSDMGAAWQIRQVSKKDFFEIPANLFFYATGKGTLRSKLQPLTVRETGESPVRYVSMARVTYNGNWDPEPGAWPRMAKLLLTDAGTGLDLTTMPLNKLDATRTHLAHMTGTASYTPTDEEVASIKAYLAAGGTLFIDVTGGGAGNTETFIRSIQEMMKRVAPSAQPVPLAPDDVLYTGKFDGGKDCTAVEYRRMLIDLRGRKSNPGMQAYMIDNRPAVIYSPEDITSGLLGTNTWGILGYAPDSAQALARNIVTHLATPVARPVPPAETENAPNAPPETDVPPPSPEPGK